MEAGKDPPNDEKSKQTIVRRNNIPTPEELLPPSYTKDDISDGKRPIRENLELAKFHTLRIMTWTVVPSWIVGIVFSTGYGMITKDYGLLQAYGISTDGPVIALIGCYTYYTKPRN